MFSHNEQIFHNLFHPKTCSFEFMVLSQFVLTTVSHSVCVVSIEVVEKFTLDDSNESNGTFQSILTIKNVFVGASV